MLFRFNFSFADKITEANGAPSGFDYMRIILASSVILLHSVVVSYGFYVGFVPEWAIVAWRAILPMFFFLSGFLVSGSLERSRTLVSFLGLRVMRIAPALALEVVLSAFILGPILTTIPLESYFQSKELHLYLLNMIGSVHYLLPGVFDNNPWPSTVNMQLWTVPFELKCYIAIFLISIFGAYARPVILFAVVTVFQAVVIFKYKFSDIGNILSGLALVCSFLYGVIFFRLRKAIPYNINLFIISTVVSAVFLYLPKGGYFVYPFIGYCTAYLGLSNPARHRVIKSGDYSYGLYLYGFPLQQLVASFGDAFHSWWINFLIALPAASLMAYLSWHRVEKPVMKLRPILYKFEDALIRLANRKFWQRKRLLRET